MANGLTLPGASAGMMSVRRDRAGNAAGLSGALSVLGGAAALAMTGMIPDRFDALTGMFALMLANVLLALLCGLYISAATRRR